jgi:unsaturated rhamnogalacturonyl hydrolase
MEDNDLTAAVKAAMLCTARQCWEQGIAAQAMLETGDLWSMSLIARDAVVRQGEDGRLCVVEKAVSVTDPACSGEAVLRAWELNARPEFKRALERQLEYFDERAPRAEDGTFFHLEDGKEVWSDSMNMAPPFLSLMGRHEQALAQIEGITRRLRDPSLGLYYHRWDDAAGDYIAKRLWSVGNGWALVGLIRVASSLPQRLASEREALLSRARAIIDAALALRRPDSLFHDALDDRSSHVDTEFAEMLAYGIYRGFASGYWGGELLGPADEMREAARAKVDPQGFVQGCSCSPHFDKPGTSVEGQAFFLLMEAAAEKALRIRA